MKFNNIVYHKTVQIMFKAKQNNLPESVQKYFELLQTKHQVCIAKSQKKIILNQIFEKYVNEWVSSPHTVYFLFVPIV